VIPWAAAKAKLLLLPTTRVSKVYFGWRPALTERLREVLGLGMSKRGRLFLGVFLDSLVGVESSWVVAWRIKSRVVFCLV